MSLTALLLGLGLGSTLSLEKDYEFSCGFKFGLSSSAYQIEGAWDEGGKGESIWDNCLHNKPNYALDKTNADVSCNSYHKYKEDVKNLRNVGVDFYRFSISWPRILPNGTPDFINREGIQYYNNLIDELLANNIQPYVTIYHWDLPQSFQSQYGGWINKTLANYYTEYARILFSHFGDRVKHWVTFNEIQKICEWGYSEARMAPFILNPGVGGYQCAHTVLLAHGKTFRLYESEFKSSQKGVVGIVIDSEWYAPRSNSAMDKEAAEVAMQMTFGWYVHPVIFGNYPPVMIDRVSRQSNSEGLKKSRLPEFTSEENKMLKGSIDFLGLNHYVTFIAYFKNFTETHPSMNKDMGVFGYQDPTWKHGTAKWNTVVPWALKELLVWIKNQYGNPPLLITENGFSDTPSTKTDFERIDYIRKYLYQILLAIYEEGCNVIGYSPWSFMDSFEWRTGYLYSFGLYHVDFNDTERPRTPKMSAYVFKDIIEKRKIDWNFVVEWNSSIDTTESSLKMKCL